MDLEYQYLIGKIQHALAVDARVNLLDIRVTVSGGKLHLTGEVATQARKDAVERVTLEVLPGIELRNELTVLELNPKCVTEEIRD